MPFIRCFIAVELPEDVKKELTVLENVLKARSPSVVKWVGPEGIHLTLKFLGEVPDEQIEEITMAMEEGCRGFAPFQLEVSGVGAFPNLNRVQVIWVGVKGEIDKLAALQKSIDDNTEQLGFPKENRAFSPHLTLGRVRMEAELVERQKIGKLLSATSFAPNQVFQVNAVYLIQSQLQRTGAIYTPIKQIILKP
jgi:RNA 2',3'-cyclic 3'-phosphodiesterase